MYVFALCLLQMFASDADIEAVCSVITGNLREGFDHTSPTTPTLSECMQVAVT